MDRNTSIDNFPHCSLLLLSFFEQKGCQNSEPKREFNDLGLFSDHIYLESDGDLQTDGHSSLATYKDLLHELQNQVQPHLPVDAEQAQAAREMAAELIRIADLLEQRVLFQAAETLTKKLDKCETQLWSRHLSDGVQGLLHHVTGAKEFKKELVEMALTFVLMKTVCERVPCFLSSLYSTVVQYFGPR